MNFSRVSLKTKAKGFLRKNFWWAILITMIFTLVSNLGSVGLLPLDPSNMIKVNQSSQNNIINGTDNMNDYFNNGPIEFNNQYKNLYDKVEITIRTLFPSYEGAIWILILILASIIALIIAVLRIFIFNPLIVGCNRWYLENREKDRPGFDCLGYAFSKGYLNTVKVMFLKDLFTFLWSLLFIIPGIVKSYEYRMIPYLLAENPNMHYKNVFNRTNSLMYGNKLDTFILDLSFLPWYLIAACLCGLLNIFYVAPYKKLTDTELYVCLCQGKDNYEGNISGEYRYV